MSNNIYVIKYDNTRQLFSMEKLIASIRNAGIPSSLEDKARSYILKKLYDGISTKEIHQIIIDFLDQNEPTVTAKYNLKRAIMELGPTGFPFERYIGRLLEFYGYKVKVGVVVQGRCVTHEVDVIALKGDEHFMIECKYHNKQGYKTNVKVPMYIKSRFEDVAAVWQEKKGHANKFHQGWVVTNTKFTKDAIKFSECSNIKLLGWDYPKDESLQKLVDRHSLYPVTCLKSITNNEKEKLLKNDFVLCLDLIDSANQDSLEKEIGSARLKQLLDEIDGFCDFN